MPTVIAQAVIRIGRRRSLAPTMAASIEGLPFFQWSSMNVTSITEFDTETPRHMIEPMNDSMFSEVLVQNRMMAMPASTPGHGADGNQGQARRLEIGGQEDEDHEHGDRPDRRPAP